MNKKSILSSSCRDVQNAVPPPSALRHLWAFAFSRWTLACLSFSRIKCGHVFSARECAVQVENLLLAFRYKLKQQGLVPGHRVCTSTSHCRQGFHERQSTEQLDRSFLHMYLFICHAVLTVEGYGALLEIISGIASPRPALTLVFRSMYENLGDSACLADVCCVETFWRESCCCVGITDGTYFVARRQPGTRTI